MARSKTLVTSCSWAYTLAMILCFTNESLATITNYIEVDGFLYATLGNADVNSPDHLGCEATWLEMPERWELVPWSDHEQVRENVTSKYSFNTYGAVLSNGGYIYPTGSQRSWAKKNGRKLLQDGNRSRYRVTDCGGIFYEPFRVLIRQEATTTTTSTTATASTTSTTIRTTTKLRKNVALASKSVHAVLGWSTVLAPVMVWAWAP